jgi:hypothetical protein
MTNNNKRIVYLLGTGATQAEASLVDDRIRLGMVYMKDGILRKIVERKIHELEDVKNELTGEYTDVEQLITLYESSNSGKHKKIAKLLRELFREEILEQVERLDRSQYAVKGRFTPRLCSALIDMHEVEGLGETMSGIMTLNYEDMIERAAQSVKRGVNYSLNFPEAPKSRIKVRENGVLVLKLHGSFNWRNEFPLSVEDIVEREEDVLWIPPGVEKHTEVYPFNIIWGKARELLDCETLRIVGCSLSRNEWHLVSMLYGTQKLNRMKREYDIEIISPPKTGNEIKEEYPHLRIKRIYEIKEVRDFVFKSLYKLDPASETKIDDKTVIEYLENKNIFEIWLKAKGDDLVYSHISLETPKNIFSDFMRGKWK